MLATAGFAYGGQAQQKALKTSTGLQATGERADKINGKQPAPPALQRRNPRYQVQRLDTLILDFPLTPEFDDTVLVQPDGYISLRGVGDIHVEGQTLPELTQSLRTTYAKILHDPIINVSLKDFEHPYFVASGEVGKPGKYDVHGDTTVTQAVAEAGGFTDRAKHSQVLLFRRVSNDWVEVKKVNVKRLLQAKNLQEDLQLQSGDTVFVPKSALSKVKPWIQYPSLSVLLYRY